MLGVLVKCSECKGWTLAMFGRCLWCSNEIDCGCG